MTDLHALKAGVAQRGNWKLSWDQGYAPDRGVIVFANVEGVFTDVWGVRTLPNASRPEQQAAWNELLSHEQARLLEFALADAAKEWQPRLERLDFCTFNPTQVVGHVQTEAAEQVCPWCESTLTVDHHGTSLPPVREWSCECGFRWKWPR